MHSAESQSAQLNELYSAIQLGANSFLSAEYKMCAAFILLAAPLIALLISNGSVRRTRLPPAPHPGTPPHMGSLQSPSPIWGPSPPSHPSGVPPLAQSK